MTRQRSQDTKNQPPFHQEKETEPTPSPSAEDLDSLGEGTLKSVENMVSFLQTLQSYDFPHPLLSSSPSVFDRTPLPFSEVIRTCAIWQKAYRQAVETERQQYLPTQTQQGYYLSDMRKNPYEFVSADDFPGLSETNEAFWQTLWMIRELWSRVSLDIKWSIQIPDAIEQYKHAFQLPEHTEQFPVNDDIYQFLPDIYRKLIVYSGPEREMLEKPLDTALYDELRDWKQALPENSEVSRSFQPLEQETDRCVGLVFHRYATVLLASGSVEKARAYVDQLTKSFGKSDEEALRSFFQVKVSESAPAGFKLHIRASQRISDPGFYKVLEHVQQFCSENDLSWKVRIPRSMHDMSGGWGSDSRYDGTLFTIWPNENEEVLILSDEVFKQEWVKMLNIAKQLDETFVDVPCTNDVSRAKTDWLIRSSKQSSNRVQIRFGENTNNKDRARKYIAKPEWEDSRTARFEDNLPMSNPDELKRLAAELDVIVEPFSTF